MIKLSILTIALFASMSANASFTYMTTIDANIVFVKPQTDESMCQASSRYIKDYAQGLGVNIDVGAGISGSVCNVDIYNISSFANVGQLASVGNYVKSLKAENYTMSSIVYGLNDGTGQPLLWNDKIYADTLWTLR
ncbi:hypothetical protein M1B34_23895 [Pseudomonas sp. MAFF 302030]|uniref:DUF4430 domain-containing protein n=1 Tax=Pseudomonas morbosilactucae TaxID=2938197 RepID=A0A9X1YZ05_9PSED|nr:hypothetical protein [Pseudomonas morbosilactucae]MCK9800641.1 hypothetical protein [Pseudomonas morbosilactucae]